ncbi:MAG: MraY family glycosyltransferase [Burkholderiales bacterium]
MRSVLLAPILSFVTAFLLLAWMVKSPNAKLPLDHPNPRSLHDVPIPRTGGLGIMAGAFLGTAVAFPEGSEWWLPAVFLMAVSLFDDWRGLPVPVRFLAHLLAAVWFMLTSFPELGVFWTAFAVVAVMWMTNLYNFMDGSDGLAGGMAVFGFSFYGIAAWISGNEIFALVNFSIAASALAFLLFNFHPARIFLGDAGSIPLGFLAAALGSMGWLQNDWPVWFPLLVFSPFIMDASVTLIKRALKRKKIWQAHREHYYQRLVQIGWGHRKTAWIEYALMLAAGASALWAIRQESSLQFALLVCWGFFYLLAMIIFDRYWVSHQQNAST